MKTKKVGNLSEKYEFTGQPSLARPDLKDAPGWNLALIVGIGRIRNHSLSPNGEWIAFIWDLEDLSDVYVIPTQGGWPRRLSFGRGPTISWDDELPAWSPDSEWIAFTQDNHVHVAPFGVVTRLPKRITDFTEAASTPIWIASLDNRPKLIASVERHEATQLVLTDGYGSWPKALTNDPDGDAWEPRPSPDGSWLAYIHRPFNDLNRLELRLINMNNGQMESVTGSECTRVRGPAWSPDGHTLAYLSQASGFYEVWLVDVNEDGTRNQPNRLTHLNLDCADLAWSPDGKQIACTVNRGGWFELTVLDVEGGHVQTLFGGAGVYSRPNWAIGGQFLTVEYESPLQPPDIYRVDLNTRELTQLTFSCPPALAGLKLTMPESVCFHSLDGLEVPALLHRPEKPNGAGIINPHGGPGDQSIYSWDPFTQYLLARGFTILEPNYRGSTGYGLTYEQLNYGDWGGGDVSDCLAAADFITLQPGIDRSQLASMGASYGGYLTNASLARDPEYRFACGVSIFGDANLLTSWAQCSQRLRLYSEIYLGHPAEHRQVYTAGSPVFEAKKVRAPLLLLHGLEDDIVPPEASEEWAAALRDCGKMFEYKTYAGEPHGFLHRANRLDAWGRILRFLNWHLLPKKIT